MKEKVKKILAFILNPRLLFCMSIAWLITNGWSYIMFAIGKIFEINWMLIVSGAYLTFLWLPISPEKIVTFTIAIALLRYWFPEDTKTLAVLRHSFEKAQQLLKLKKEKKLAKRQKGKSNKCTKDY